MKLQEIISVQMWNIMQKKKENQRRYKTDQETGEVLPFIFKLVGTGVLDNSVKPPKEMNRDYLFSPTMQIYDKWAKGNKFLNIANVVGTESRLVPDATGSLRPVDIDTLEPVQFNNGCLSVPFERDELLCIAMFAHNNTAKPRECKAPNTLLAESDCWYEDNSTLYTGYVVNKANDIMLKGTAINYAKGYSFETKKEVLKEASKTDRFKNFSPDNKLSDAIENDIFVFANDYPREFLHTNVREETRIELLIHDATSRKILVHDADNAKYVAIKKDGKEQVLVKYNKVNDDPKKAVFAYFMDPKNEAQKKWIEGLVKPSTHPYLPEVDTDEPKEETAIAA